MITFSFENIDNFENFIGCEDINNSGIKRFGFSPLVSATNIHYVNKINSNEISFKQLTNDLSEYIISASVNHSPDDWTGYNAKVKSLFLFLNEKYLNDLKNKRALLLLDQSFEGYQTSWLWDFFHSECSKFNIPPCTIIYVTGNVMVEENYNEWCKKNNISDRIFVIGYPHFEIDVSMNAKKRLINNPLPTFDEHINYKKENDIKTFGCLNKRIRQHRVWFYGYLYESNLLERGLISMNEFQKHGYTWEGKTMDIDFIEKISKPLPLLVYNKSNNQLDDNYYINRFNDDVCLDTYVSVVSEAQCGDSDETIFLSEKIFKPIACMHPFIVMGNKNSLKKMRELGYKTYDDFIDQTYDELPTHDRLKKIIESIKKIDLIENKLDWYKLLKNDLEYNYNLLMSKNVDSPPYAFIKLRKYYYSFFKKI